MIRRQEIKKLRNFVLICFFKQQPESRNLIFMSERSYYYFL